MNTTIYRISQWSGLKTVSTDSADKSCLISHILT